ncbi:hypothetical protein F5J12DRAFT_794938 [Pisolithus orientalis]|uniref:uncharacterized protein n=1 Tax=Pisolithus orientalis TaxID=936130 RepID=UPI002225A428|nr:uncharacterized protein F5J12DRAFT_794938 [Pisolithus orientalis]KAI6035647.1 hypothetical protein F5J12DRAFT_794938 [Pisolithus orientalis]
MASVPPNPDTRELPFGWIQQYNWEYGRWYDLTVATTKREPLNNLRFYVNTREQPPRSTWEHPLGPPQPGYSRSGGYAPGYQQPYGSPQPNYGPPANYSNAPQGGYMGGGYQGLFGGSGGQQQPKRKTGMGVGTALLAGAAGLAGGALLTDAFEHHEEREREEAYDDGYDRGYDQGCDQDYDPGYGFDDGGGW